jgi:lysophospholipase L1-like esterase
VKRLIFAACVAFAAFSATPAAVPCKGTATCALPVASGDLVAVFTRGAGTGAPTDSQGNVYVLVRQSNTYRSQRRVYSTAATATGTLTVTFPSVQDEIVVLDAAGYLPTPDVSASFPPSGQGGSYAICPPTAPLTVTTTKDGLLISDWALDGTVAIKCSALSGAALPGTCGGATSQINYEVATAGIHTQQFTFLPVWNAGNANCGLYSFPAIPVQPPPVVTPGGWVFVGDSITANEFSVATQWHAGGINAGVAGNTTQLMLDRFPTVLGYKPAGIVLLGGANDINGLAGATTAAAIAGRLTSMADAAIAAGVQVVMCSILPLGAARAPTAGQLQMILDTNALIKAYVAGHPGTRYADYFTAMVGSDGLLPATLSLDGLHPTAAGYAIMLPVTEAAINPPVIPPPAPSGTVTMASQLGDMQVTRSSDTTLTICAQCSNATPANVRTADIVTSFSNPSTVTLTGGTGTVAIYVDSSSRVLAAVSSTLAIQCASGCLTAQGTDFPPGSVILGQWAATNGKWDQTGRDLRAFLGR